MPTRLTVGFSTATEKLTRRRSAKNATDLSSGNLTPDTAFYLAQVFYDRGKKAECGLPETILKGERPFSMRPEAQELMDKLAKEPKSTDK